MTENVKCTKRKSCKHSESKTDFEFSKSLATASRIIRTDISTNRRIRPHQV